MCDFNIPVVTKAPLRVCKEAAPVIPSAVLVGATGVYITVGDLSSCACTNI